MSKFQSFIDKCLMGIAHPDEIDDYVDSWHESEISEELSLADYLGMDSHEYAIWMRQPDAVYGILRAHRTHRNVDEYVDDFYSMPLAARADTAEDAARLTEWLKDIGKL